jgi:hypothetical protein
MNIGKVTLMKDFAVLGALMVDSAEARKGIFPV